MERETLPGRFQSQFSLTVDREVYLEKKVDDRLLGGQEVYPGGVEEVEAAQTGGKRTRRRMPSWVVLVLGRLVEGQHLDDLEH